MDVCDGTKGIGSAGKCTPFCQPVDDNLVCAVCISVFANPQRTACGHVFCDECIRHAIVEKPACPTCRAPVAVEELAPDRLAGAMVDNLPTRCHFSASGCSWMGKHGELQSHLASSCPCVLLTCPSCEMEVERGKMWAHSRQCGSSGECPYGCGERFADADRLAEHRAVCLMEPRKLMAALGLLQRENERLSSENLALRADRSAVEASPASKMGQPMCTPRKRARRPLGPGKCEDVLS